MTLYVKTRKLREQVWTRVLEEEERSRQGMVDTRDAMKRPYQYSYYCPDKKPASRKRTVVKNEDLTRIANKVTHSIACHIDRMVKKRQPTATAYPPPYSPYAYQYSPFHNVNNPFWAQQRRRRTSVIKRNPVCPSCLRSFSSTKTCRKEPRKSKSSSKVKIKKTKKKKEKSDKKIKKSKEAKKEAFVSVQRPVFKTLSENLVEKPKTIWAKELLDEYREKAVKDEEKLMESSKQAETQKEREKTRKNRDAKTKSAKPKSTTKKKALKNISN